MALPVFPFAAQIVELEIERLEGPGLLLEGLHAGIDQASGAGFLQLDAVTVDEALLISDIRLQCSAIVLAPPVEYVCTDGELSLSRGGVGLLSAFVDHVRWWSDDESTPGSGSALLNGVPLLGDGVAFEINHIEGSGSWRIELNAPQVDLAAVSQLLPLPGLAVSGSAVVDSAIELFDDGRTRVELSLEHRRLAFEDATADHLGDGLDGRLSLNLEQDGNHWEGTLNARWHAGELLTPFAYVQADTEHPLVFQSRLDSADDGEVWRLTEVALAQAPWIRLDGELTFAAGPEPALRKLRLAMPRTNLATLVERYLEPVLAHPLVSATQMEGRVSARIDKTDKAPPKIQLNLDEVSVRDDPEQARFSLEKVTGKVILGSPGGRGRLSWQRGSVFQFQIGAADIPLSFGINRVAFAEPARIPILDGALDIDRFVVDWQKELPDVTFDAVLEPVSMPLVAKALDWIPMQGRLSGVIPRVSLSEGELQVGGSLLVRVFDGTVVIRNLYVSDLFGYFPTLTADVESRDLDLELLTGTYEFGRITGRLEGEISGLRLEEWQPVAFDAHFRTPDGDDSPHRISQRAVDNIAGLAGGGATGMVSRGFLRFFDEFKYDRLGISCRLRQGLCEMDGVEPANNGYYLVKGGGIPRIDVIGFNRSTDWETLVQRVLAAASGGSPVIE